MNKKSPITRSVREHQTARSLHGWHFDQMRRATDNPAREARITPPRSGHTCCIDGCNRSIRIEYLMCEKHWHMVSIPTQRAVYATWRSYAANKSPHDGNRYRQARAQAIAEVTASEGRAPSSPKSEVPS